MVTEIYSPNILFIAEKADSTWCYWSANAGIAMRIVEIITRVELVITASLLLFVFVLFIYFSLMTFYNFIIFLYDED
jgi:hypothetical protein